VLRTRPLAGRTLLAEDEGPGRDRVAVISRALWQRRFNGDPHVVGRSLDADGPLTIVGVMPDSFAAAFPMRFATPADVWQPYVARPEERTFSAFGGRGSYLRTVGRLKDGVTLTTARTDVERIAGALKAEYPRLYGDWRVRTTSLIE